MLCIVSAATYAGCENSTMRVHTDRHLPIKVYVDGNTGSNPPTENVTVRNIYPGRHRLKVVEVYTDSYGYRVRRVVYDGMIKVHPSVYMEARVDEGRGVAVHETDVDCDGNEIDRRGNNGQQHQGGDYHHYDNESTHPPAGNNNTAPAPSEPVAQAAPEAAPAHMSDADFAQIKNTIIATKFETKKMDTLRTLAASGSFDVAQVSELMGLFAFESNKLDVAKMMYPYTVDKQNYKRLESNFNFEARKKDFEKFLGER